MNNNIIKVTPLGQVGFRFEYKNIVFYIDPYLSNSVQEKEDSDCARLVPIPILPEQVDDADYVLITHAHRDHCDEDTLKPLSISSPESVFICPEIVSRKLRNLGIPDRRIIIIREEPVIISQDTVVNAIPAAHPKIERNPNGGWLCVGYVMEFGQKRLYHAGDTSLASEIIERLSSLGKIDIALIPVNECNYYRNKKGIIGNMSVRDAFGFAEEIHADVVVPTHWDMFAVNQVYKEEIELLYNKIQPDFQLQFEPTIF